MTPQQIRSEVASERRRLEKLDAQAAAMEVEIRAALVAPSDRVSIVEINHAKGQKARLDQHRETLRERIDLLERELPSSAQVAEGRRLAEALIESCMRANVWFETAWGDLSRSLEDAERASASVLAARASAFRAIAQLRDLRADLDLTDLVIPDEPAPAHNTQRLAQLQAAVIEAAAAGHREIDSTVARYLAAVRREMETQAVGAPTDREVPA